MKSYGIVQKEQVNSKIDAHIENIKLKGFSIEKSLLSEEKCAFFSDLLETIYHKQEKDFGRDNLTLINELDMVRMPFLEDKSFFDLFSNDFVLEVVEKIIGRVFHLHLQNGIINRPQIEHHQTSWHRDLPYQDWVISKPLAVNAFYCLSDFNTNNGATFVLPYSHRTDHFPSSSFVKENEIQVIAPKGSVIFFDSMIYHRAGSNASDNVRYGLNNLFVVPIIKQQTDIASFFADEDFSPLINQILGKNYATPKTVHDFRTNRLNKTK